MKRSYNRPYTLGDFDFVPKSTYRIYFHLPGFHDAAAPRHDLPQILVALPAEIAERIVLYFEGNFTINYALLTPCSASKSRELSSMISVTSEGFIVGRTYAVSLSVSGCEDKARFDSESRILRRNKFRQHKYPPMLKGGK
jgi:hypothetical protein